MNDTPERRKQVNFVDYFVSGESFFEQVSGGPKVTNLSSLCGLTVAVEVQTVQLGPATGSSGIR